MKLKKLHLIRFRNYDSWGFDFNSPTTVFVGQNAQGKTNILESISLLSTGESFRAQRIEEMISFNAEVAHVAGLIEQGGEETKLQIRLTRGMVGGRRVNKRSYQVNDVNRQKKDFVGQLLTVIFLPEDLRLVEGSPTRRRQYLDTVLSQVDREYRRSLGSYEKALRQRNKLLDLIQEGKAQRTSLMFWDQVLIKDGNILTQKRRDYIEYLNSQEEWDQSLRVEYDFSAISEERLAQYARQEVAAGHTLVGPHKDDFIIFKRDGAERNIALYGSRGEHRMAVLWLKLGEMAFIEKVVAVRPVLLLDDIFSELDHLHRDLVLDLVGKQQTILTTADEHFVEDVGEEAEVIKL